MSGFASTSTIPLAFILPDLVSHCTFPLRANVHSEPVAAASQKWMDDSANFSEKRRRKFFGLKAGHLTGMCYPDCGEEELRVCSDFMNYLFNLDDWSDEFDSNGTHGMADCVLNTLYNPETFVSETVVGTMARDFWKRMIRKAAPGCQQRFIETFDMFFQAVTQQAQDRAHGDIPDLEEYISMRRDTSGCKPVFVLIEYAAGLDLPDEVAEHPIIRSLNQATNDLVTWSNDIFSYNVEQARGDTHNMIPVIQRMFHLDLQTAVDFVGSLCKGCIDRFVDDRTRLPSWGPEIDAQVQIYVQGLQDWIVGSLHWSFMSERYFGKNGQEIKRTRRVTLLSKVGAAVVEAPPQTAPAPVPVRASTTHLYPGTTFLGGIIRSAAHAISSSLNFKRNVSLSLSLSLPLHTLKSRPFLQPLAQSYTYLPPLSLTSRLLSTVLFTPPLLILAMTFCTSLRGL